MTADIIAFFQSLPEPLLYVFLFFSNFLENIFPPWPADVVNVMSGFLSARGVLSYTGAFVSITLGNTAGAVLMFFAGEKILNFLKHLHVRSGNSFWKKMFAFVSGDGLEKTAEKFKKSEFVFVLLSRFFAGIRFFVSIVAGLARMSFLNFFVAFSIGASLWTFLLLTGGYFLGDRWEDFLEWLKIYNIAFFSLLVLMILLWMLYQITKRKT